ncbi:helix-turn-helix transcriptional regulator [Enterococcus faecalis]|uniref:helix-turn-helix transcriptional regulator n=1 Tax=Enterococcus faecalis TaxID=1351 RepID=UPI00177C904A|nr:helix-turn-helix transcriptional regulator [Enterococcus faecalis]MBD9927480.1 helix-turn-helix transcriptional regulator [Enterococcus faecalis]
MKVTLRALRVTKNLTQKEAAEKVGVSTETWANYEKFKTFPDVLTIKKIESVFNVNYEDIIFLP